MKSLYLNKEINISGTENVEKNVFCTSHRELEKALIDTALEEQRIIYNYEFIKTDKEHAIVLCTISDKNGRRIQSVGESMRKDCEVATDAAKKAFDKAVITYFNFEKDVILDYCVEKNEDDTKAEDSTAIKFEVKEEVASSENIKPIETNSDLADKKVAIATIKVNEEISNVETEEIQDTKIQITTFTEDELQNHEDEVNNIDSVSDNNNIGNILVTIGKYAPVEEVKDEKGKIVVPAKKAKTVREIYEEDRKWFDYICDKFTKPGKKPEHLEQANAMREYAKNMTTK